MAFESLLSFARLPAAVSPFPKSIGSRVSDRVLQGRPGGLHDESTFRHLLAIERRRAGTGDRKCLLVLVRFRASASGSVNGRPLLTSVLSEVLGESVREIDLIGWYRQGRVAAVLLPQGLEPLPADVPRRIVERIRQRLAKRLPDGPTAGPRLRLVHLGGPARA